MSTQLKAQQGLTNLTPIKVIHILISLAIMVCFKFVPAAEPLTPLGVEVIGIFLGMLYGWLIANDSFWPSIFGLLFLGLSSYSTVPAVLRDGFGIPPSCCCSSSSPLPTSSAPPVSPSISRAGSSAARLCRAGHIC